MPNLPKKPLIDDEIFIDVPWSLSIQVFLESLLPARRDLLVDPLLRTPWSCAPDRCRPALGVNLCCKVETRCPELTGERCGIHRNKPFSCALFPIDLIRVNGLRAVTTARNAAFFKTGWSRYDADMLECFTGSEDGRRSMFATQRSVLLRVFTRSEVVRMEQTLANVGRARPG